MKNLKALALTAALLASTQAFAATQSVTANISFDTPLTLTKVSDINFGTVKAGVADTYTISTAAAVTAAGSGQWLFGTKTAGNITVVGSSTNTVNISVSGLTADGGVTLANPTCKYGTGSVGTCALNAQVGPGAGKTLLVGIDAVVDGTQVAGATAAPSLTVTVVYP